MNAICDTLNLLAEELAARAAIAPTRGMLELAMSFNESCRIAAEPDVQQRLRHASLADPASVRLRAAVLVSQGDPSGAVLTVLGSGPKTVAEIGTMTGHCKAWLHATLSALQDRNLVKTCGMRTQVGPGRNPTLFCLANQPADPEDLEEVDEDLEESEYAL